jgi:hypothetical protein
MDEEDLEKKLVALTTEHRDLDVAIQALIDSPAADPFQIKRLKRRKLLLRDEISLLHSKLTPDIIA